MERNQTVVSAPGRDRRVLARVLVVVSVVALVACGLGVWTLRRVVVAPSGGATPTAAVMGVFASLGRWADDDAVEVVRYLCKDRSAELRERVRGIRADMASSENTELVASRYVESPMSKGVRVTVMVEPVTTMVGDRVLFGHGDASEWRFDVVGSGSTWRVCGWESPEICGVYAKCETSARKD